MMLRTADYDTAVSTLTADALVIDLAREAASMFKPEYSWDYAFVSQALREYTNRNGKNQDAAHHHIGAVAEAIRKINNWN